MAKQSKLTELEAKRHGCFPLSESRWPMPPGWMEIQRCDNPEIEGAHVFACDEDAARFVSSAARYLRADGVSWSLDAPAGHKGTVCVIVPVIEAIERGVLVHDACWTCGDEGDDCGHLIPNEVVKARLGLVEPPPVIRDAHRAADDLVEDHDVDTMDVDAVVAAFGERLRTLKGAE